MPMKLRICLPRVSLATVEQSQNMTRKLSRPMASEVGRPPIPRNGSKPINLFLGWPAPDLLPPKLLQQAGDNVLSDSREVITPVLEYGADPGYLPLRKEIAAWLTEFYDPKDAISYERICISGGASQNLACILQTFTDPVYTRNVFMVAPTYHMACRIFTDSGFDGRLRGVPEDAEGIDLNYLEKALHESEEDAIAKGNLKPKIKAPKPWRKIYKYVLYCVPQFSNPTGRIMSLAHRRALVKLARKHDVLIITDDVYDMLQWPSSPNAPSAVLDKASLPRIVDIDRYLDSGPIDQFGHAISNGSFSKIASPGCRTGWGESTEAFAYGLSQTGTTRSGGSPSQLVASFMHDMLVTGTLQNHVLHFLQPSYARRYHTMIAAIEKYLIPLGLTMPQADKKVAGGYFIWLTLPEGMEAESVVKRALEEEKVIVPTGAKFQVEGDEQNPNTGFERDIRLSFAWEEVALLEEGVRRLASVVQRAQSNVSQQ